MRALIVAILLTAFAAVAVADPSTDTDTAREKVKTTEKKRAKLASAKLLLSSKYAGQLDGIDKLKRQKASWRRDRQLKSQLADSLETAKKLADETKQIRALDKKLAKQRRAYLAAIDAELGGSPDATREAQLHTWHDEVAAKVAPKKAQKIVLPDDEIDPLADPDELDQQAAALKAAEAELTKQVSTLDADASKFTKQAELRKQHERAGEMAAREDDQPRHTSASGATADTQSDGAGSPSPEQAGDGDHFAGDPAVVLQDVVDGDTVDDLRKAERSSDPQTKADAAGRARDAVQKRLDKLAKRRKEIEARARALRE
jgi:hypothetical protein